jgi:hypothetical protein
VAFNIPLRTKSHQNPRKGYAIKTRKNSQSPLKAVLESCKDFTDEIIRVPLTDDYIIGFRAICQVGDFWDLKLRGKSDIINLHKGAKNGRNLHTHTHTHI